MGIEYDLQGTIFYHLLGCRGGGKLSNSAAIGIIDVTAIKK